MSKFSKSSLAKLETCHVDLRTILNRAITADSLDFTIICGHRGEAEQNRLFEQGRTKARWPESMHNRMPSMAVDVAPWPDLDWNDRERFTLLAGFLLGVSRELLREGRTTHRLRWGGDWDMDFKTADNNFDDLPHFELRPVPRRVV